jgi:hypothetical protein
MELTAAQKADLDNRFGYHPATTETAPTFNAIRQACRTLSELITLTVPEGRERSLALTNLEYTMYCSNAGIARKTPLALDPDRARV